MSGPAPLPLTFRRSAPSSVTHHPQPLSSSPPVSFRAQLDVSAHGAHVARPVATRTRPASFAVPQRADKAIGGGGSGGGGGGGVAAEMGRGRGHSRSRSHGEMRVGRGSRMVSFGSAVTPASGGSTTDGEEVEGGEEGRESWEWPWDEEEGRRVRVRSGRKGGRSDSSGSEAEGWRGGSPNDRVEMVRMGARYARTVPAPRSQSALAGAEMGCRRADGPRPWDMTELSQTGKNFASFGFRKNGEAAVGVLGEGFGGKSVGGKGKGKGKGKRREFGDGEGGGGRRRFRFLRKKISVSSVLFRS